MNFLKKENKYILGLNIKLNKNISLKIFIIIKEINF